MLDLNEWRKKIKDGYEPNNEEFKEILNAILDNASKPMPAKIEINLDENGKMSTNISGRPIDFIFMISRLLFTVCEKDEDLIDDMLKRIKLQCYGLLEEIEDGE